MFNALEDCGKGFKNIVMQFSAFSMRLSHFIKKRRLYRFLRNLFNNQSRSSEVANKNAQSANQKDVLAPAYDQTTNKARTHESNATKKKNCKPIHQNVQARSEGFIPSISDSIREEQRYTPGVFSHFYVNNDFDPSTDESLRREQQSSPNAVSHHYFNNRMDGVGLLAQGTNFVDASFNTSGYRPSKIIISQD